MTNELMPDELGAAGESLFATLCAVGRCSVAIRGPGLLSAAVFDAEMVAGLPLKAEGRTWLRDQLV